MEQNHYEGLRNLILSFNFSQYDAIVPNYDATTTDKQTHSIYALIKTESNYLERIKLFLSETFLVFHKTFNHPFGAHIISKDEVVRLFRYFPYIYSLHAKLNKAMINELESSKPIGKVWFDFLVQDGLLETYEDYVTNISDTKSIYQNIEKKSSSKIEGHKEIENVIMTPIQRFPQLCLAIRDVYKYTPIINSDKVNFFKAWSVAKSITSRLDIKGKIFESNDFIKLQHTLKKLSIPFTSTQMLSKSFALQIKVNHNSSEKVKKILSILFLCDKDIIMIPNDMKLHDLSKDLIFCYPLKDIFLEQQTFSIFFNFLKENKFFDVFKFDNIFQSIEDKYLEIKGSKMDKEILNNYKQTLNDYIILKKMRLMMSRLNFIYNNFNIFSIDKTIVEVMKRLNSNKKQLDELFQSFISLQYYDLDLLKCKEMIIFDSSIISKDWKSRFTRSKIFSFLQTEIDWLYYPTEKFFIELNINELPLFFQPYQPSHNKFIKTENGTMKYQSVMMAVDSVISPCLWICGPKSQIITLHFDNKEWSILESFNRCITGQVVDTCTFTEYDSCLKHIINSEIWLASGSQIFIYSLINTNKSTIKEKLNFTSNIKALCNIENDILVALKTSIIIYSKVQNMSWQQSNITSIQIDLLYNEEIKNIQYGNKLLYVCIEKKVIIYEINKNILILKNMLKFDDSINAISFSEEGVWTSIKRKNEIILYDKFFINKFHILEFPSQILSSFSIGNITSLYSSKKYLWVGTETGCIICVSTINSSYCVSSNVSMHVCSTFATGSITEFIPFKNDQSTIFKKKEHDFDINEILNINDNANDIHQNGTDDETGFTDIDKDETDCLTGKALEVVHTTLKDCCLPLILAIGTGVFSLPILDETTPPMFQKQCDCEEESTIFTFFE